MNKKLFIMGAPNAGKSTFLAALWHSVNQKTVQTELTLSKMIGDSNYLYSIEKKWLQVDRLERTAIGQEKEKLSILLSDGRDELELEFPDLSGETFQNIYEKREMSIDLKQKINDSDAILYFVNVQDIHEPEFISELPFQFRQGESLTKGRVPCEDDPTQVQIIDLLQVILGIKKKINLGIIFSAWDLVDKDEQAEVVAYLQKNLNMLWQYLQSNKNIISAKIWGVSAIGGKIEDEDELLEYEEPIQRIKIVNDRGEVSNDLTSIISEVSGDM